MLFAILRAGRGQLCTVVWSHLTVAHSRSSVAFRGNHTVVALCGCIVIARCWCAFLVFSTVYTVCYQDAEVKTLSEQSVDAIRKVFFGYFIRFWYSSSYYLQTLSNLFIPNHLAAISYDSQRALFWFKTLLNVCLAPACLESEYFALRKFARLDNRRHKSLKVLVTLCWLC